MEIGFLPKVRFSLAAQMFAILEPSEEVAALSPPDQPAADLIVALAGAGQYVDAIRYLAVALPRREAVWWACVVGETMLGEITTADSPEGAAWKAAEAWVYEPTELRRQATYPVADALKFNTAGAYAALGAFWSGGSLAPPESGQVVPPGDGLTGSAVGASILLSCVPGDARAIGKRHMAALSIGADIANGGSGKRAP